jgi:oligopeptidase B
MYVTAAVHDSQVKYHELAKWVAKLRSLKTDAHELLFVTDMESGHTGKAGRFDATDENARIIAWLITQTQTALRRRPKSP